MRPFYILLAFGFLTFLVAQAKLTLVVVVCQELLWRLPIVCEAVRIGNSIDDDELPRCKDFSVQSRRVVVAKTF